jgi:hypothetical protein
MDYARFEAVEAVEVVEEAHVNLAACLATADVKVEARRGYTHCNGLAR